MNNNKKKGIGRENDIEMEPLDRKKVEKVIGAYSKKYARHKQGVIIFVGSGGGKSTVCRNQKPGKDGKMALIDADLIYRETEAHPVQPGVKPLRPLPWWDMGKKIIEAVEGRCGVVNQEIVKKGLWALTTSFDPGDGYIPDNIVIVLLPWEEHKRRIREKTKSEHYDGGAKATEEGFALVLQHRKWAEEMAKKLHIPIVESIDAAIELVSSRED